MTDHAWLPAQAVADWTGKPVDDPKLLAATRAAAAYCESVRSDITPETTAAAVPDDVKLAGMLAADRLMKAGRGVYSELGAQQALAPVSEIARLLGITTEQRSPRVG